MARATSASCPAWRREGEGAARGNAGNERVAGTLVIDAPVLAATLWLGRQRPGCCLLGSSVLSSTVPCAAASHPGRPAADTLPQVVVLAQILASDATIGYEREMFTNYQVKGVCNREQHLTSLSCFMGGSKDCEEPPCPCTGRQSEPAISAWNMLLFACSGIWLWRHHALICVLAHVPTGLIPAGPELQWGACEEYSPPGADGAGVQGGVHALRNRPRCEGMGMQVTRWVHGVGRSAPGAAALWQQRHAARRVSGVPAASCLLRHPTHPPSLRLTHLPHLMRTRHPTLNLTPPTRPHPPTHLTQPHAYTPPRSEQHPPTPLHHTLCRLRWCWRQTQPPSPPSRYCRRTPSLPACQRTCWSRWAWRHLAAQPLPRLLITRLRPPTVARPRSQCRPRPPRPRLPGPARSCPLRVRPWALQAGPDHVHGAIDLWLMD